MNPVIAAAMAACLQHMSAGMYEKDFEACEQITVEYNMQVESMPRAPASFPQYHEAQSRADDAAAVARAASMLLPR